MISTSNGWRSIRSVECGLRPSASEISLPAPANFPFGDDERLTRDPGRVRRGEEDRGGRDVLRLSDAAERRHRLDLLPEVAVGNARRMHALRLHHAGIDRVDADLARPEF